MKNVNLRKLRMYFIKYDKYILDTMNATEHDAYLASNNWSKFGGRFPWVVPFVTGHKYRYKFQNEANAKSLVFGLSKLWKNTDKAIYF
jgi:hypothetical protein